MAASPADDSYHPTRVASEKSDSAEDVSSNVEDPETDAPQDPSSWLRFLDMLPPWVLLNLRSSKSLKMLGRCWVASWLCYVILLPQQSLNVLGNA